MLVPGVGTIGVYGGVVPPPPSVGIDLVDVRDVARSVERFGARYLSRVYTDAEIAYAQAAKETRGVASRLGARFAAKEATLKALRASERGISLRTIEIIRHEDGSIDVALSGAAIAAAREAGDASLAVSVSHEGNWAVAVVIAQARRRWKR
jgi:holo-[acyl-carrier protein] synthase